MKLTANELNTLQLSDRETVDRVLNGEQHLFELIMRRYNQTLYRIARSILNDRTEAEDVLQDAYIQAFTHLSQFRGTSIGPWMATITRNEALSRIRGKPRLHLVEDIPEQAIDAFDMRPDTTNRQLSDPEFAQQRSNLLRIIESAVDKLPEDFRMVFMLRAVEQLSTDETAKFLQINPATVKTRFFRAKSLLQKRLNYQVQELASETFTFGGQQCDRIVAEVFKRIESL